MPWTGSISNCRRLVRKMDYAEITYSEIDPFIFTTKTATVIQKRLL